MQPMRQLVNIVCDFADPLAQVVERRRYGWRGPAVCLQLIDFDGENSQRLADVIVQLTTNTAALLLLGIVWGFSIVADSAQFSALIAEFSPRTQVGTALTLQTCVGFLLTMVSMRLLPGVAAEVGWRWAFLALVPGPILGAIAMRRLARQSH